MAIQVFQEHRKKKGLEAFNEAFSNFLPQLESFANVMQEKREKNKGEEKSRLEKEQATNAIMRLTGRDTSGLPIELQKDFLSKVMQGENEAIKQQAKYQNQLNLMNQLGLSDEFGMGEGSRQNDTGDLTPTQEAL